MSSEIAASTPANPSQQTPSQAQSGVSSKPPVSVQPGSHLDPGAYVRGSFPISIGQNVLIHPRAHLLSVHSPLIIGDGCVVSEKCVLGGPLPNISQIDNNNNNTTTTRDTQPSTHTRRAESLSMKATVIEDLVYLHPSVTVGHGATVRASSVLDANVTIEADTVVGSHSKICSNLTISETVPDWTVIFGTDNDQHRRTRVTGSDLSRIDSHSLMEQERVKTMELERNGTVAVLRAAAAKALGSGSRSKR